MMPELNGWETCRILREGAKGKSLPIIMLTALSNEDERVKGLSHGADDYLSKPYSMKELLLKIKKHIYRQQTINQLQTREREQDTSVRYMVHELQNALSAIGGFSSLALRKGESNKYMKTINMAASHAESLLQDASLLSRLELGKEVLTAQPVAIGLLVDETIELLRDTAKKKHIEITSVNSSSSLVHGNRTAIKQVMINLLSNAIKYNREGGTIRISFDNNDDRVNISIQDDGDGIGQAEIGRIFDKFYRATGSERVKGAGLGLYIVKHLAEAMGGKVSVVSKPGTGSTFTVTFVKVDAATPLLGTGLGVTQVPRAGFKPAPTTPGKYHPTKQKYKDQEEVVCRR